MTQTVVDSDCDIVIIMFIIIIIIIIIIILVLFSLFFFSRVTNKMLSTRSRMRTCCDKNEVP